MTQRRNRAARVYHAEIAKRSREQATRRQAWHPRNRPATAPQPEDEPDPSEGEGGPE